MTDFGSPTAATTRGRRGEEEVALNSPYLQSARLTLPYDPALADINNMNNETASSNAVDTADIISSVHNSNVNNAPAGVATTHLNIDENSIDDSDDWQCVLSKAQKRKRDGPLQQGIVNGSSSRPSKPPPTFSPRDPRIKRNRLEPVESPNQFQVLAMAVDNTEQTATADSTEGGKKDRAPPIHLQTEVSYLHLKDFLCKLTGPESFSCKATTSGITIHPATSVAYRAIVRSLRENKASFYTYQLGEDKSIRVVLRGLHHSIGEEAIKEELVSKGFRVRSVTNVLSRDKIRLPLFFVDMDPVKESEEIFKLDSLFMAKIKVERPRQARTVVQCTRCQRYGHTKGYCALPPRCVKCAGPHETQACTRTRDTPATCVLCQGCHPASYKGCNVYQELQNRRSSPPVKRSGKENTPPNVLTCDDFPHLQPELSTRNCTLGTQLNPHRQSSISYSHILRQPTQVPQSQESPPTNQLHEFISEIKSIISPLISLMSQLLTVLLQNNK